MFGGKDPNSAPDRAIKKAIRRIFSVKSTEKIRFLRDTTGERPPCLHERTFDGQRTSKRLCRKMSVSRRMGGFRPAIRFGI